MSQYGAICCMLLIWIRSAFSFNPSVKLSTIRTQSQSVERNRLSAVDLSSACSFCLEHSYLPQQALIGGSFCVFGDAISQSKVLIEKDDSQDKSLWSKVRENFDTKRSKRYLCKGLGGGLLWASWYGVADGISLAISRKVECLAHMEILDSASLIERSIQTAVSISLEQFLVCPLMFSFWDIPLIALLSGSPWRQIPEQVESKLGPLLIANAKVWTPVNLITYNIPTEYRVLYSSCADILWQSINAEITSQDVTISPKLPEPIIAEAGAMSTELKDLRSLGSMNATDGIPSSSYANEVV